MLNAFLSSLFNFIFGGAFLRHFLSIREFAKIDQSKSLASVLIAIDIVVVILIKAGVIWAYQQEQIKFMFLTNDDSEDDFTKMKRRVITFSFFIELIISVLQALFLSLHSLWFVYTMFMFRRCIEQMQEDVKRGKN